MQLSPTELLPLITEAYTSGLRNAEAFVEGAAGRALTLRQLVDAFLDALEQGSLRAASRGSDGVWRVHPEVKQGILLAFRVGTIQRFGEDDTLVYSDKDTLPPQRLGSQERRLRVVPGGSSVRRGAYLADGVTCMPPMYVNVGAYVGEDTMVDSHALVGSCAQIGARVHLSAAAQIGGVLEPIGLRPVVIEDDVLVGGGVGVYEGTLVRQRAVLGAGVILTASTPVYDLVRGQILRASATQPLEIPEAAVVVAGARPVQNNAFAEAHGLHLQCALIVKYRDEKTDLRAALEGDLR